MKANYSLTCQGLDIAEGSVLQRATSIHPASYCQQIQELGALSYWYQHCKEHQLYEISGVGSKWFGRNKRFALMRSNAGMLWTKAFFFWMACHSVLARETHAGKSNRMTRFCEWTNWALPVFLSEMASLVENIRQMSWEPPAGETFARKLHDINQAFLQYWVYQVVV